MMNINEEIRQKLFTMQDIDYREFHLKLVPTLDKEHIIGIRTPILRKYSKELFKNKNIDIFLSTLPHYYYEENNLHAFCIEQEKDYDKCILLLNKFLPYIDNWATCDSMSPPIFAKNKDLTGQTILYIIHRRIATHFEHFLIKADGRIVRHGKRI